MFGNLLQSTASKNTNELRKEDGSGSFDKYHPVLQLNGADLVCDTTERMNTVGRNVFRLKFITR